MKKIIRILSLLMVAVLCLTFVPVLASEEPEEIVSGVDALAPVEETEAATEEEAEEPEETAPEVPEETEEAESEEEEASEEMSLDGIAVNGTISFQYHSSPKYNDTMITETCCYSDSFFDGSATVYDHELAIASLCTTMTATSKSGESDTYVRNMLKAIGCEETNIRTARYDITDSEEDVCGYAFGLKKLPGTNYYLLPIFIRSSGYGGEWVSNMRVTESGYDAYSAGFKKAADFAYDALMQYIADMGIDREDLKIWVTGFSRGAAVANLLAARITADSGIPQEQIYGYTFATPTTVLSGSKVSYSNIFNVVSEMDVVTEVPLRAWGFARYGQDLYLPCQTRNGTKYAARLDAMQDEFFDIMDNAGLAAREQNEPFEGQELLIDLVTDYLADTITTKNIYLDEGYQSVMMALLERVYDGDASEQDIDEIFELLFPGNEEIKTYLNNCLNGIDLSKTTELERYTRKIARGNYSAPAKGFAGMISKFITTCSNSLSNLSFTSKNIQLVNLISDIKENGYSSKVVKQHWPETYLAWMRSGTSEQLFAATSYKELWVKGSADVCVYNSSNQRVAATTLGKIVDTSIHNALYVYVDEYGNKQIFMPEDDTYQVEVTALSAEKITVVSKNYTAGSELSSVKTYMEMPAETNQKFTVTCPIGDIEVTTSGTTVTPDTNGAPVSVTVTVIHNGKSTVYGSGTYTVGDTVELTATEDEDGIFLGWYDGDTLLTKNNLLTFLATEDRTVTAQYRLGDLNGDSSINARDLVCFVEYLSGANVTIEDSETDINGDSEVDIRDLVCLMKQIARIG